MIMARRSFFAAVLALLSVGGIGLAQDSLGMERLAALEYWGEASGIQMTGNLAYVVSVTSGLHILDVTDAAHPQVIGRYTWYYLDDTWGGVCVTGSRAYVATGGGGFVLDVSNPAQPTELGEWYEWPMTDISVYGDIGICEDEGGYPYVLDVHDPASVHEIAGFPGLTTYTRPVGMLGNYLCLTGLGMSVWDLSNPAQPLQVAAIDTLYTIPSGTMSGNYAYLSAWQHGLRVIDMSSPLHPVEVAACDSGIGFEVAVSDSHAVMLKDYGLDVWNILNPAQPIFEGRLANTQEMPFNRIAASRNRVCNSAWGRNHAGRVVDISNPAAPAEASEFGTQAMLRNFVIQGATGYIADGWRGLRTVNLGDPTHPIELGNTDGPNSGDIAVRGRYAYLADYNYGLFTYDMSDPANPESLYCWHPDYVFQPARIVIAGDYAYLIDAGLDRSGSIRTFSLIDSVIPQYVDSVSVPYMTQGFDAAVANGYLYFAAETHDFQIYGLADPAHPQWMGTCTLPSTPGAAAVGVAVLGHYACVADCEAGLRVIDVNDPVHPIEVAAVEGLARKVAAHGTSLAIAGQADLRILDMSDPLHPQTVGFYDTDEVIRGLQIVEPYLLTTSLSQLRVYHVDALASTYRPAEVPREVALHPCYPNPFNPSTVIGFYLPSTEHAQMTVYDETGRQVRVLLKGTLGAGEHRMTFDGSSLASGVYFVRLETRTKVKTEKLMLLK